MSSRNCRTCGKFIFCSTPKNLFQEPDSITLHQIEVLTGLFLLKGPGPAFMCAPCEQDLQDAISFRERVILTQKTLQSNPSNVVVMDLNDSYVEEIVEEVSEVGDIEMQPDEEEQPQETIQKKRAAPEKLPRRSACPSVKFADNSQELQRHKPRTQWDRLTEEEVVALKRERRRRECICEQCGRHFSCPSNFKLHLLRHSGVKSFACEQCPQRFYTATLLRRHQELHAGTSPFQCRYCEAAFNNATGRLQHERIRHTHAKPFKCKECDKSFSMSGKLRTHMLSHTGVRAFHCESCKVSFVRRSNLLAHFRSKGHAHVASTQEAAEKGLELDVETVLEGGT
ncbi:transcription factor Ouib [Drosophila takahashii]|uniref:transcription factor Ouib n=1 Tax=Drosophila takahashii TaxID=29030 RepID=UPI001CF8FC6C|nr:transcription factor Ouib [Drosophila takahashii]